MSNGSFKRCCYKDLPVEEGYHRLELQVRKLVLGILKVVRRLPADDPMRKKLLRILLAPLDKQECPLDCTDPCCVCQYSNSCGQVEEACLPRAYCEGTEVQGTCVQAALKNATVKRTNRRQKVAR